MAKRVVYVNFGHDRAKAAFAKLRKALEEEGVTRRYSLSVEHVTLDSFDPQEVRTLFSHQVASHPDVLVAPSSFMAIEARAVTREVPIIFASRPDPVDAGLMRSLDERDTNLAGLTLYLPVDWKRLELLRESVPAARRVGIVVDHYWLGESVAQRYLAESAAAFGIRWVVVEVNEQRDLGKITAAAPGVDAWLVTKTIAAGEFPERLVKVLEATRKPALYPETRFAEMGGYMSYDAVIDDPFRVFARQIGLVLAGVPPARIPVVRPKRFELVVNTAAARGFGVKLDRHLIARADRVL
ncbi:hypothetical protein BWI17_01820 [Betaproteobacteria bacterium GR16-43]|nr:hypothetical protein BWI17_01820 [Betaproteobacteria bacterium GR16-43]